MTGGTEQQPAGAGLRDEGRVSAIAGQPAAGEISGKFVSGPGPCGPRLTRADLDTGIDLGGRYLLAAQRPGGDFVYEVDWTTGQESPDDSPVRQAGATWGVALLCRETRDPTYRAALDRSLARWDADARAADGRRWQGQQGARPGKLGTVALVGLSLLERLAAPEGLADPATTRAPLNALCAFVEDARLPGGGFGAAFDPEDGTHAGPADPYSSGEALLLLARSGLELGVPDRVARALAWAEEDYDLFVAKPLAQDPDPDLTKGYYQWGSMNWFTLASAGHAPEIWGRRLIEQALWMVDVHRTLTRTRNTGYAYEGIVPAWEWARRTGDDDTARKLACVVHQGLRKLCSWQLGHPLASAALRLAPERFHGAVQNHAKEPALRIDVTQHQVHALMYARQFGIDTAEHLCGGGTRSTSATPSEHEKRNVYPTSEKSISRWAARDLAEITGGVWEVMPPEGWTMRALAFASRRLRQRQTLVICKCRTCKEGIGLKHLTKVCDLSGNGDALLTDDTPVGFPADVPRLRVASVRDALARLAAANRANFPGRIVAVTGSSGKSTTCTMVKDLLQAVGVPARSRFGSFNTFDGVNVIVANLANEAAAVIEVSHVFLAQPPCGNLRPDIALITNVGEAHLEELGSRQGVAERKSTIFDHMPGGTAVIPRDADTYDYMLQRARAAGVATVSFGSSPEADARLLSYSPTGGLVEAQIFGEKLTYQLGALGRHFAQNSVGALAVVAVFGLDWRRAAAALVETTEIAGRGVAIAIDIGNGTFTLIDDAYNANPSSVRAALAMLSERPVAQGGRRIAVLADMLELGPTSEDLHRALADPILQSAIGSVYLVGQHMRALWDILPSRVRGGYSLNAADLWTVLEPEIAEGDVVLFKGSHSTDLHKVVAALRTNGKRIFPNPVAVGAGVAAAVVSRTAGEAAPVLKGHHVDLTRCERTGLPGSLAVSAQAAMVLKIPSVGAPQTVYAKNPRSSFPPYSLTKLLTTITALNVASRYKCSSNTVLEMIAGDEVRGSGRNISVGDRFSFQDAIANMMLPSSNATANVVARTFGQLLVHHEESGAFPVARFVQEMNATAASLGMSDSTFANPHGLHASAQITTAADMAKLLVDAIERPAITRVWGRATYNMTITGPNVRTQQIRSSVRMIDDDNVRGGKTGTLPRAEAARIRRSPGYNLAIYSQTTSGSKLASVLLHASSHKTRYADMRLLLSTLDEV